MKNNIYLDKKMEFEYEKYITNKENLKITIEKYGVAIIPNVLNNDECDNIVKGMWDYFEYITQNWEIKMNRKEKTTWKNFYNLYPLHSMLVQHWQVAHSQIVWDTRQNEKIVDIFANFWECDKEDLLVSFDGISFNPPPEITNRGWNRKNTWFHTDQSFLRNKFECIQSWVTGLDVDENDATLAFYEKSNLYHEDFSKHFNIVEKKDWYKLNKLEEEFYINKGCSIKKIKCPKGSIVFWDSRTIHCGSEATKDRKIPKFRSIIYLCYMPRILCNQKNLIKKQKAFNELRTTNHYPCKPKLFSKEPRTYGNPIPNITKIKSPILNNLGKKLAGF